METSIRLLGPPAILRDGDAPAGPRGRKAWALLAYLLLSDRPPSRRRLAELLFADAADPLGALRWNLAQLRRSLDGAAVIEGDPVEMALAPGVAVDVHDGDPAGGELLEGLELDASPAFASWLLIERRKHAGHAATLLHGRALSALAADRPAEAAELAARLVAADPFDEAHHELLVRALAVGGDRAGALAQVAACQRLFRAELGREPSAAVRRAADAGVRTTAPDRVAARAQLEAGKAAVAAGALEHGLACLRQACELAAGSGDGALEARALLAHGTALVHAVRGRDEEGAASLHAAVAAAEAAGDRETLVASLRELAFADLLAGRRAAVGRRLVRAGRLARGDAEHAAILAVQGINCADTADYPGAFAALGESVERAERCGDHRRAAFSLSFVARSRLLRDELHEARDACDAALERVEAERWLAFLPFPEAIRGEIDLRLGDTARAAERMERAFTLGCQVQDPCWEALAARNLGLLSLERGDMGGSREWLDEARTRCVRLPDRYVWMQAHVTDTSIRLALDRGDRDEALRLNRALGALAARTEMREFVVRSLVHAARLGEDGALVSARMLAAEIDNPALARLVASAS